MLDIGCVRERELDGLLVSRYRLGALSSLYISMFLEPKGEDAQRIF